MKLVSLRFSQIKPPEVDSGSAAAMVWVKRFEKIMLVLAYILTCFFVLAAAVASKGITLFVISQVFYFYPYTKKVVKSTWFLIDLSSTESIRVLQ